MHRYLYYVPEARVSRFIAANAGWYTMPDFSIGYPYGLKDAGIEEDALRILRFFRFHAYYGQGEIAGDDYAACAEKASNVAILSGERVAGEILRLLAAEDPVPVLD